MHLYLSKKLKHYNYHFFLCVNNQKICSISIDDTSQKTLLSHKNLLCKIWPTRDLIFRPPAHEARALTVGHRASMR